MAGLFTIFKLIELMKELNNLELWKQISGGAFDSAFL